MQHLYLQYSQEFNPYFNQLILLFTYKQISNPKQILILISPKHKNSKTKNINYKYPINKTQIQTLPLLF